MIITQLNPKQAAKFAAHKAKYLNEAKRALSDWMDAEGFAEIYQEEVPSELRWAWARLWDQNLLDGVNRLNLEFTYKRRTYWLTK